MYCKLPSSIVSVHRPSCLLKLGRQTLFARYSVLVYQVWTRGFPCRPDMSRSEMSARRETKIQNTSKQDVRTEPNRKLVDTAPDVEPIMS